VTREEPKRHANTGQRVGHGPEATTGATGATGAVIVVTGTTGATGPVITGPVTTGPTTGGPTTTLGPNTTGGPTIAGPTTTVLAPKIAPRHTGQQVPANVSDASPRAQAKRGQMMSRQNPEAPFNTKMIVKNIC